MDSPVRQWQWPHGAGVPSPAAHLLSNHYNQTRTEYYRQLDRTSKSGGDILPFVEYAVRGFVDGLRQQLEYVWGQQWEVVWENYVHDLFGMKKGAAGIRQCDLALALGRVKPDWVEVANVRELTSRLASEYAGKTQKTVGRDLAALDALGLVIRDGRRVRARREIIFAFLPFRRGKTGQE